VGIDCLARTGEALQALGRERNGHVEQRRERRDTVSCRQHLHLLEKSDRKRYSSLPDRRRSLKRDILLALIVNIDQRGRAVAVAVILLYCNT
jgi:hypothetical protein